MFRKFSDEVDFDEEDDDDDLGLLASRPDLLDSAILENSRQPLSRSSIKPRVLFPIARDTEAQENDDVDEEAATDIEDHVLDDAGAAEDQERVDINAEERPVTPPPNAETETPQSPGASIRSLRPRAKRELEVGQTPTGPQAKKKISPFDGWLRKKPTPAVAASKAKKRDAEAVGSPSGPSGPAPKKTRGTRATASSS